MQAEAKSSATAKPFDALRGISRGASRDAPRAAVIIEGDGTGDPEFVTFGPPDPAARRFAVGYGWYDALGADDGVTLWFRLETSRPELRRFSALDAEGAVPYGRGAVPLLGKDDEALAAPADESRSVRALVGYHFDGAAVRESLEIAEQTGAPCGVPQASLPVHYTSTARTYLLSRAMLLGGFRAHLEVSAAPAGSGAECVFHAHGEWAGSA